MHNCPTSLGFITVRLIPEQSSGDESLILRFKHFDHQFSCAIGSKCFNSCGVTFFETLANIIVKSGVEVMTLPGHDTVCRLINKPFPPANHFYECHNGTYQHQGNLYHPQDVVFVNLLVINDKKHYGYQRPQQRLRIDSRLRHKNAFRVICCRVVFFFL